MRSPRRQREPAGQNGLESPRRLEPAGGMIRESKRNEQRVHRRNELLCSVLGHFPVVLIPIIQEYATTRLIQWSGGATTRQEDYHGFAHSISAQPSVKGPMIFFDCLSNGTWHKRIQEIPYNYRRWRLLPVDALRTNEDGETFRRHVIEAESPVIFIPRNEF